MGTMILSLGIITGRTLRPTRKIKNLFLIHVEFRRARPN